MSGIVWVSFLGYASPTFFLSLRICIVRPEWCQAASSGRLQHERPVGLCLPAW